MLSNPPWFGPPNSQEPGKQRKTCSNESKNFRRGASRRSDRKIVGDAARRPNQWFFETQPELQAAATHMNTLVLPPAASSQDLEPKQPTVIIFATLFYHT
jgi:hypothetical protein